MSERRALLVTERRVSSAEREAYVASLRDIRDRCVSAGVQFWAFEQGDDASRFLEFAEAKDASSFEALGLGRPPAVLWHSVELR